jgi:hypothetical protein
MGRKKKAKKTEEKRYLNMKRILQKNNYYFLLIFFIIMVSFLASCDGIAPDSNTINATAGAGGSIDPSGTITVNKGESQTFTITPEDCYQVDDLLVDGVSVGSVTSYTLVSIQQDYTIQATFVLSPGIKNIDTGIEYLTIQAAIDVAQDGETIVVCPGIYYENIEFDGKDITLQSTDPTDPDIIADTIIDGEENGTVIRFNGGDTSTIKGFTIQNGNAIYGGGVDIGSSSPIIENNIITNNTATGLGGGIRVVQSSPTISNNQIIDNIADAYGAGIYINWDSELLPTDARPAGWGTGRENIPTAALDDPAEDVEYEIAGNIFLGNQQGTPLGYSEGTHVYFH